MEMLPAGETRIWTTLDFNQDGKQHDWLRLPFSTDLSAYGVIPIPITCIKNGAGPTALLIAGNHGDEYEGQVALSKLARQVEPRDARGRILILPALNYPAVVAGRRLSPLDEGNLNRLFPGEANGTPTQMIAHYVSSVLLSMADIVIDLHSGGSSLYYLPCCLIRSGKTGAETARLIELMQVFGAPIGSVSDGTGGGGATTLSAIAQAFGVVALTTELGGGGGFSSTGEAIASQGIYRVLKHIGVLPNAETKSPPPVRLMQVAGRGAYTYAPIHGIFEPAVELGDSVEAGQSGGFLFPVEGLPRQPEEIRFAQSGLVACRRAPALAAPGDCLFKLVTDVGAN
ncbi:succinylglutamate desuccinylase/aspartoacylase family protein [Aminobacter sp. SR38]|jgi:predicted deacylase|uniref:succinylglutamate desuccinylase/aspartoacylase family protein n=1 Tax=Aminobacter sp. SR38 TaxID=2774562 RepID=UPI00177FF416|nr:succinylglutamate desuccinylase/aspartoacylase family protein [Aminobacter sp. SR38]QOF70771.1 succinylglutamate desuccinylase/aspartoacylase family protein [Aminobacter sp. SR38]